MGPELSFNRAIQGEYHQICEILDHLLATDEGRAELIYDFGSPDSPDCLEFAEGWFMDYRFHPNRTKRIIAEHYRKYASELPATYHDSLKAGLVVGKDHAEPSWRDKLKPNSLGRVVAAESTLGHHILSKYYESKFTRDATQVALAAIAYRKQHGDFPHDLNELVGYSLKEVPVDPLDGKPLLYDTVGYVIYTVGPDGLDDPTHRASQKIELLDWSKIEATDEPPQRSSPEKTSSFE
ncbi:MAG: hypothetical protein R3242_11255, partial [Akkermansiaceae bacterium]|nr:hypothetical protein [Akkermansiaceae bacterium]